MAKDLSQTPWHGVPRQDGPTQAISFPSRDVVWKAEREHKFVAQLEALIKGQPYDIENLQLSIPTLKGLMEHTPAHMTFDLASTAQETVQPMLDALRGMVAENHLVWLE